MKLCRLLALGKGISLHFKFRCYGNLDTWGILKRRAESFLCMNINSLPKHLDELGIFIEQKKPHVVCLNETKTDDTIDNEVLEIDDYQLLRNDRTRHEGGVALYLHRSVWFTSRDE